MHFNVFCGDEITANSQVPHTGTRERCKTHLIKHTNLLDATFYDKLKWDCKETT